jgi:hypothetical protein
MIEDAAFYDDCSLQLESVIKHYTSSKVEHHQRNSLVTNKGNVRYLLASHSQENDMVPSPLGMVVPLTKQVPPKNNT